MDSSSIIFCPSCGKNVERIETLDIHAHGFQCEGGHYLHSFNSEVCTSQTIGSYLSLKSGKESPEDVLKEWLTDPRLRNHLNDNLAGIIRFILDKQNGKEITTEPLRYTCCPSCGEALQDVTPEEELHETVLKCRNNHTFLHRGGIRTAGSKTRFSFDYDEKYFRMSYKSWMENKHFSDYFPHEIREALLSITSASISNGNGLLPRPRE